ncbi:MAG TPA: heme o synthase [Candidatus Sulfotelmatobacter sp.]|nr:heme o synthase [Candidatus Sulfotelmatobacter sp.]
MKLNIVDYVELTKPKVTLLNLFVGLTCFLLAAFPSVNWPNLTMFALAGYFACGGSSVVNCVYDRNIDSIMERTSKRAIPTGRVSPRSALVFGSLLIITGICIGYFIFNALTGIMMASGVVLYLVVYTITLKRTSKWNVVIGGLAGCFAAFSGWTAITNTLSLTPLLISTVDFLWTPGHLWGLAIKKVKEYKKARIPMLSVTVGIKKTAQTIFLFNVATIISSLLFPALGLAGILYLIVAAFSGFWLIFESRKLAVYPSEMQGFKVFVISMPYLACIMIGLLVDKLFL